MSESECTVLCNDRYGVCQWHHTSLRCLGTMSVSDVIHTLRRVFALSNEWYGKCLAAVDFHQEDTLVVPDLLRFELHRHTHVVTRSIQKTRYKTFEWNTAAMTISFHEMICVRCSIELGWHTGTVLQCDCDTCKSFATHIKKSRRMDTTQRIVPEAMTQRVRTPRFSDKSNKSILYCRNFMGLKTSQCNQNGKLEVCLMALKSFSVWVIRRQPLETVSRQKHSV